MGAGSGPADEAAERRLISATCGGVRVMSVYVPNGRTVASEHFQAKLEFLDRLRQHLDASCDPMGAVVLCGDFNVAPEDIDVFDPAHFVGATHVTPEERGSLAEVMSFGLTDVFRAAFLPRPDSSRGGTTGPATSTPVAVCGSTSCWRPGGSPTGSSSRSSTGTR